LRREFARHIPAAPASIIQTSVPVGRGSINFARQ